MASLKSCKTCKKEVSTSAKVCPHCGQKLKSGLFVRILKWTGGIFLALIILALIIPESDETKTPAKISTSATESNETKVAASIPEVDPTPPPNPLPASQIAFLAAISKGIESGGIAKNDMQKGAALLLRDKAICASLPSGKRVKDWHGEVYSINANSDGKGVLVMEIHDDAWVSTWNNALSDIGYGTLIEPESAFFNNVSNLSSGDKVIFSGEFFTAHEGCAEMQNMMLSTEPPPTKVRGFSGS